MSDIVERLQGAISDEYNNGQMLDDAADTIESLRQQLAGSREALRVQMDANDASIKQLLESQAYAEKLREALENAEVDFNHTIDEPCLCGTKFESCCPFCGAAVTFRLGIDEALSLPSDHTALDEAIKAAKVEALRDAAMHYEKQMFDHIAAGLRSMAKEIKGEK